MPQVQIETLLCPSHILSRHFGRHLVFLKMLNDVKATSVRFFNGNILATRISKEKSLNRISGSSWISAGLNVYHQSMF